MPSQFETDILSQINDSIKESDDQNTFLLKVLSIITDNLKKNDNKINPDVIMATISSVLDIVIPRLALPPPQLITRKIAKKIILNAIKPIIYGEK